MLWVGLSKLWQQPVIMAYQGLQALTRLRQKFGFCRCNIHQARDLR
jgi:hypothetical protein